jgi:CRISPR-associated protein Csd2
MIPAHLDPQRRQDAVLLFDVTDGNPNGDPDAGNLPRVDPETMNGLVTDVAIKRKVRDFVAATQAGKAGFRIYVQGGAVLNNLHEEGYTATGRKSTGSKQKPEDVDAVRDWMCKTFYDIRTFGAVMTTEKNAGQVRGPAQISFARSIDPVVPLDFSITRVAITKASDAAVGTDEEGHPTGKTTERGRKPLLPYGLYRANVFISPLFANQTGFAAQDLDILWHALTEMWDLDRSAARGTMASRGLHVFSHTSPVGNAAAEKLFERVSITRRDTTRPARAFSDYDVTVNIEDLPAAVSYTEVLPYTTSA